MNTKDENYYENQLKTKINQHSMLSNTFYELINKGVDDSVINKVKGELDNTLREIKSLRNSLNIIKNSDIEYSFYDNIKKDNKDVEKNTYATPDKEDLNVLGDFDLIFSNRFLVNLSEIGIENEWFVKTVDFGEGNEIGLTIYDHLVQIGPDKYSLREILNDATNDFSFKISYLGPTGEIKYEEKYLKCRITGIFRSSFDYEMKEPNVYHVKISYDSVVTKVPNCASQGILGGQKKKIIRKG